MSTYVLMRILESAPQRYDLGIRLLTLGKVDRAYDRLVEHIRRGQRVLDMGCGTGALTLRAARRGARVKGIDVNPQMLEIAAAKSRHEGLTDRVKLEQVGVAELDREADGSYDAVLSGLCLSELTEDERAYALEQIRRILQPGGLLLVADEVRPKNPLLRFLHRLLRAPLVMLTYLLTQQTTHSVADLPERLLRAGLQVESVDSSPLSGFATLVARKPDGDRR